MCDRERTCGTNRRHLLSLCDCLNWSFRRHKREPAAKDQQRRNQNHVGAYKPSQKSRHNRAIDKNGEPADQDQRFPHTGARECRYCRDGRDRDPVPADNEKHRSQCRLQQLAEKVSKESLFLHRRLV